MFHNVTSAFNQDKLIAFVIYVTFVQKVQKIRDFFFQNKAYKLFISRGRLRDVVIYFLEDTSISNSFST